jgi:hypothetical protein
VRAGIPVLPRSLRDTDERARRRAALARPHVALTCRPSCSEGQRRTARRAGRVIRLRWEARHLMAKKKMIRPSVRQYREALDVWTRALGQDRRDGEDERVRCAYPDSRSTSPVDGW